MEKKSVSASLLVLYLSLLFAVIGACFSTFVYKGNRILVTGVAIENSENVMVFEDIEMKKQVTKLKLSNMDVGLKPATGELDAETQIPSTITDEGTTEGYYATVYVSAVSAFRVNVSNIEIQTEKNKEEVSEQRKNIFVAIKDVKNSVKSLEKETVEIARFENVNETQKLTFLIWIGSMADDVLKGAKISFKLEFLAV